MLISLHRSILSHTHSVTIQAFQIAVLLAKCLINNLFWHVCAGTHSPLTFLHARAVLIAFSHVFKYVLAVIHLYRDICTCITVHTYLYIYNCT